MFYNLRETAVGCWEPSASEVAAGEGVVRFLENYTHWYEVVISSLENNNNNSQTYVIIISYYAIIVFL